MTRGAPAWQMLLADLALILFIVTASALSLDEAAGSPPERPRSEAAAHAVMRAAPDAAGARALARWLASYRADPREYLTLRLTYREPDFATAQEQASRFRDVAKQAGHDPRLILERGAATGLEARFAFDLPPDMARNLQH